MMINSDGRVSRPSVAEIAAESMREHIIQQGVEPGTRLGSLDELIESLGISRGSGRETIRLLESKGLVTVKTGPNGGIYVSSPDSSTVTQAASAYLHFQGVTVPMLYETRKIVEPEAARMAAIRLTEEDKHKLTEHLSIEAQKVGDDSKLYRRTCLDFHVMVARLTANKAVALFVEMLIDLTYFSSSADLPWTESNLAENHKAHRLIAEAIITGDGELAGSLMARHLKAAEKGIRRKSEAPVQPTES